MACHRARFVPVARVESRLAAAGLALGEINRKAQAFENLGHGEADLGEKLIDETGNEERDPQTPQVRNCSSLRTAGGHRTLRELRRSPGARGLFQSEEAAGRLPEGGCGQDCRQDCPAHDLRSRLYFFFVVLAGAFATGQLYPIDFNWSQACAARSFLGYRLINSRNSAWLSVSRFKLFNAIPLEKSASGVLLFSEYFSRTVSKSCTAASKFACWRWMSPI